MSNFVFKARNAIYSIEYKDIIYFEKNLRKITVHIRGRGEENTSIDFFGKISEIEGDLDERFMKCHRSYLINMDSIVWMKNCEIYLTNNRSIHLGRDTFYKARVIFTEYLKKKFPEKKFYARQWI